MINFRLWLTESVEKVRSRDQALRNLMLDPSRDYSLDDAKKAYRQLALKYHPDRNQGVENDEFKNAALGWEYLDKHGIELPKAVKFGNKTLRPDIDPVPERTYYPRPESDPRKRKDVIQSWQEFKMDLQSLTKRSDRIIKLFDYVDEKTKYEIVKTDIPMLSQQVSEMFRKWARVKVVSEKLIDPFSLSMFSTRMGNLLTPFYRIEKANANLAEVNKNLNLFRYEITSIGAEFEKIENTIFNYSST